MLQRKPIACLVWGKSCECRGQPWVTTLCLSHSSESPGSSQLLSGNLDELYGTGKPSPLECIFQILHPFHRGERGMIQMVTVESLWIEANGNENTSGSEQLGLRQKTLLARGPCSSTQDPNPGSGNSLLLLPVPVSPSCRRPGTFCIYQRSSRSLPRHGCMSVAR